jgi:hypothetical protein
MAISSYKPGNTITYTGLSTDTKPTAPNTGDKFLQTDGTPALFIWTGSAWLNVTAMVAPAAFIL